MTELRTSKKQFTSCQCNIDFRIEFLGKQGHVFSHNTRFLSSHPVFVAFEYTKGLRVLIESCGKQYFQNYIHNINQVSPKVS